MTEAISTWRDLLDTYEQFKAGQWSFRGDCGRERGFKTSLERAAVDRWGRDWGELPVIEEGLLRRFKREVHLYLSSVPDEGDLIGWLSLMRHHGAPTRLLDWSYSFFVALFFAIERAEPGKPTSIWAMDLSRIWDGAYRMDHLRPLLDQDPNAKREDTVAAMIHHDPPIPGVFRLNPWKMNRRLIVQQSLFLVPGDITLPFMENLEAMGSLDDFLVEIPLSTDKAFLREVTRELLAMNMMSSTLFPGLDGFARNLTTLIPFPELRVVDSEVGME
jgi:hypothetical protein